MQSLLVLLSFVALSSAAGVSEVILTTLPDEGAGMDPSDGCGDTGRLIVQIFNTDFDTCEVDFGLPEIVLEAGGSNTISVRKAKKA